MQKPKHCFCRHKYTNENRTHTTNDELNVKLFKLMFRKWAVFECRLKSKLKEEKKNIISI